MNGIPLALRLAWKPRAGTAYSVLSTRYFVLFAIAISCAAAGVGRAAPPKLNHLFPAGCQRGQSVVVTASGDFSTWPVSAWADRPGLSISAEQDKGKLRIEAAADAVPGTYWVRLHNADGAAVVRPFIVGTLPEAAESEPNDAADKPQAVAPRIAINGKLGKSGDLDGYRLDLKRGQTLVASLLANSTLGAPMDAVLQLCELVERPLARSRSTSGSSKEHEPPPPEAFVIAQNHDAVGLDPQLAFTAPRDGAYLVRVFAFPATPDSSIRFAGGDDYLYRLTLTTGPFIDHVLPPAAPREEAPVRLGGWNLEAAAAAIVPALSNEASPLTPPDGALAWVWRAEAAGAVAVPRTEHGIVAGTLRVPFAEIGGAQADGLRSAIDTDGTRSVPTTEIPVPSVAGGRFDVAGQADGYLISATKDQKLRIRVAAKALGLPTDPVVAVLDETGKTLAEADDTGRDDRDPQLDFTPPATGRYKIVVRDLAGRGDVRMVYRLSVEPVLPDFSLSLAADSYLLEKEKPLEITVNVAVRDGLREPIEIHAVGLPPGVTAQPVKFEPAGDSPTPDSAGARRGKRGAAPQPPSGPSVKLVLKADPAATIPSGSALRIEGKTSGAAPLVRTARFPLNLPLAGQHYAAWLTVK